ncbi:MAG: MFS transporter [Verrucomicrobiota bacterium]
MPSDSYAPLRRPAFRRFLTGAQALTLSNQVMAITAGYHLYDLTHSAWSLLLVGLMSYLPILLFSLPAGWAADHFDRRKVLTLTLCLHLAASASLLALVWLGGPEWPWYPLLFVAATSRAFHTPSAVSLYPLLIEAEEMPRAVSWSSANYQAAAIMGPILGGCLLHQFGVAGALTFVLAGPVLFLLLLPGLVLLRHPPKPVDEPLKDKVLKGLGFVWNDKAIFGALSVDFVAVLFGGVEGILPMFQKDILHCGPLGLGFLRAAMFVGALMMSIFLAHRPPMRKPGKAMLASVGGFGLCMLCFAASRHLYLSLATLVAAGMFDQVSVLVRQTLVQMRTPEALRGRVQAVNFLFIGSSNELGEVESGLTAGLLGPVGSVLLGGMAVLVIVSTWAVTFPALRDLPGLGAREKT